MGSLLQRNIFGSLLQRNIFGLRRRNNELNELTNFVAALEASETTKYIWARYYNEIYLASDGVTTN